MSDSERLDQPKPREELIHTLRLSLISGVGPRTRRALLDRFGSSEAALNAAPSQLRSVEGVGAKLVEKIVAARQQNDAEEQIARCRDLGVTILADYETSYPALLGQIHDPPAVLFLRGEIRPQDQAAIAIVGTRHATHYGIRQAERLAASLAQAGLTIVSGLARGIDAAAHRGALAAGGRTLAVLGSGVLNVYPAEHEDLAAAVIGQGALISEAPPLAAPHSGVFPQRNRIISGLSLGVIVVEADHRSGALITARQANEQGREVFAVPGRVDDRTSHGCHRLIRDGAKLVESADNVLEELGPMFQPAVRGDGRALRAPAELLLNELEQQVLDAIETQATSIDTIVSTTGLTVPQVLSTISVLEMRHLIRRLSGATVIRI